MNIETITLDPESAQRKLRAYRAQLYRRADAEYEAIARGYRELAAGHDLINLSLAIRAGGFDEKGRPRIAIARADRRQVEFDPSWRTDEGSFDTRIYSRHSDTLRVTVSLPATEGRRCRGYALVPLTPADIIEEIGPRINLAAYFVLWEVEEWADRPLIAQPDRDPYLLRHLGGELYAVLAGWDLTELERAVMAGRRMS